MMVMNDSTLNTETEQVFTALTRRINEIIDYCECLSEEKRTLEQRCTELHAERQSLIEQNEQARARIDAMVARLKGLEQKP